MTGFLELTGEQYHADELGHGQLSLSRSVAHILCTQSPAHAWTAHPKLNPNYRPVEDPKFDVGVVVHEMLLGGEVRLAVVDAPDWRTKVAQEARVVARAEGKTPLLAHQWAEVQEMAEAVRDQIEGWNIELDPPLLTDGQAEVCVTWEDEGVVCRARLDWYRDDRLAIDDLKTTTRSASPEEWSMFSFGGDLQAFMYTRAVEVITGITPAFRFIVCETEPPYAVTVVMPGPDVLTLARKKFAYAAAVWRRCLETGEWPAYPLKAATVELPAWLENKWLLKEEREMVA